MSVRPRFAVRFLVTSCQLDMENFYLLFDRDPMPAVKYKQKQRESLALRRLTCYSITQKSMFVYKKIVLMATESKNALKNTEWVSQENEKEPQERKLTYWVEMI